MNLEIDLKEWSDHGVTISIKGEVDVYTAAQVRQKVLAAIDRGRNRIVVNLQEVTYLDSTGLGVLIGVLRRARENQGDMMIACAHPRLLKIFEITGLARIFRIYPDEGAAAEALAAPTSSTGGEKE